MTLRDRRPAPAPCPVSLRGLTIGLCMTVVAIAFETIAVATAMPVAARELDGLGYYAWSFSLFLIGMLFATVVAGRLSDRIGPGQAAAVGLVVFVVGLLVAGTATTWLQLIGGRLIQGLGSGADEHGDLRLVAKAFDARQRPRMFTYISTAWVVPSFVGPPVVGVADPAAELALGVLRRPPAGARRRNLVLPTLVG